MGSETPIPSLLWVLVEDLSFTAWPSTLSGLLAAFLVASAPANSALKWHHWLPQTHLIHSPTSCLDL